MGYNMELNLYRYWYGGIHGDEKLPENEVTLYITGIFGELLNGGQYNGAINYKVKYPVRALEMNVYVDNVLYPSSIVFGDVIHVDGPATGNYIHINYYPLSDSYYFGDMTDTLSKSKVVVAPFKVYYITNILYKLSQIEYILGLPISKWCNNQFITEPNLTTECNLKTEPYIMYKIINRINIVIDYINKQFNNNINKLENGRPTYLYEYNPDTIMKVRTTINNIQNFLINYYGAI